MNNEESPSKKLGMMPRQERTDVSPIPAFKEEIKSVVEKDISPAPVVQQLVAHPTPQKKRTELLKANHSTSKSYTTTTPISKRRSELKPVTPLKKNTVSEKSSIDR